MVHQRHSHQTTLRFSEALWQRLQEAAVGLEVSVAQYVRDAARARLDASVEFSEVDPRGDLPVSLERDRDLAVSAASERSREALALQEQGRLARQRANELRGEALRQRARHAGVGGRSKGDI